MVTLEAKLIIVTCSLQLWKRIWIETEIVWRVRAEVSKRLACNDALVVAQLVASDTRGPGFEFSYRPLLLNNYLLFVEMTEINKKRPGMVLKAE